MPDGNAPPGARLRPGEPTDPHRDLAGRLRDAVELWRYRRKVRYWERSGVRFGRGVLVMPTAELDTTYGWMISVGDRSRIGHRVRILVHDASAQRDLHHGRVGPVTIGKDCLIAEGAVILPGVTIGDRVIVAAGSVAAADISPNSRVMGVPARVYGTFDDYLEETRRAIAAGPRFGYMELHALPPDLRERALAEIRASGGRGYSYDPFSISPYYVTPPDGDE
jgi:acetyltransferase-like isoleucine patch superfamily enzyme